MSNNTFTLTFKLQQHTPIIHFQHEQEGATLRATELKPKLDRFIIEKMGWGKLYDLKDNEWQKQWKNIVDKDHITWFVGKDKAQAPALDYKVKIETEEKGKINISMPEWSNSFPCFFANMGKANKDELMNFKMYDKVTVKIFSLNSKILLLIKEFFANFLLLNNFGTRQSKGFGCFTVKQGGTTYAPTNLRKFKVQTKDTQQLFAYIELFYKTLRGGCNGARNPQTGRFEHDFYAKPLIFAYAKQNHIQWEKRAIKQTYYPRDLSAQEQKHGNVDALTFNDTPHIVKDLLGLSSAEKWESPYKKTITKESIGGEIERFKSPITFKPIKVGSFYEVYVLLDEIPTAFLQSEFAIKSNSANRLNLPVKSNSNNRLNLPVKSNSNNRLELPVWSHFNLQQFWNFALAINWDNHLTNQFANHPIATIIKQMYQDLNQQ